MLAITSYSAVVAIHVAAVVIAFGVTFSYPIIMPFFGKNHPQALAPMHEAQERIGKFLITPGSVVALITGIYLAADRDLFDRIWVQVPMAILIILMGLGGAFFAPRARRAAELARSEPGSPAYMALVGQVAKVGQLAGLLVLVAVFFMVAKPGGY
jgi:uncharacterized membrane protein